MAFEVKKLSKALGAEVTGVDLCSVSDEDIENIKSLLVDNMVLFFPGQTISQEEHVEFGAKFGELEGHPNLKNKTVTHPKIFELAASTGGIADEWHTDITYQDSPAIMSVLHMVKCPEIGGDTMWSNLNAAYEALSDPLKDLCEGITALHDASPHGRPDKTAIHPVVRLHPVSGKKVLYVNEHFTRRIVEMTMDESDMLLSHLTKWVTQPQFTVRYHWTEGTIAMWDNRSTQHYVVNDFDGERIIQRVTVMGDEVNASSNPRWRPALREGYSAVTTHDKQLINHLKNKEAN
ncbi:MAG: taurine dioxygenase [Gammaproteobacteria bacterium]|jgi:taurine dioxygenase|nr:taurine dioxygenase [Gammaproteobacteria bacterium]|tara:strand:- start:2226 stop:3098 length:873 start_codon:yes stop_codon:yes gene_type:complete